MLGSIEPGPIAQGLEPTSAGTEPSVLERLRVQSQTIPASILGSALATAGAEASTVLGPTVPAQVRRWEALITGYANQNGLDPNLVAAIIMTESGGDPNATSPRGAVGLMQVVGGSYDPETNIAQGTKIFADDLRQLGGNVELALAAYNAGINSVTRYQGIPPYLETQNYVFEVLNRYYLYSPS